jgi:hypothetical protein
MGYEDTFRAIKIKDRLRAGTVAQDVLAWTSGDITPTRDIVTLTKTSTGTVTPTLADGVDGQTLTIIAISLTPTSGVVIAPTNFSDTNVQFNASKKYYNFLFTNGKWNAVGGSATLV